MSLHGAPRHCMPRAISGLGAPQRDQLGHHPLGRGELPSDPSEGAGADRRPGAVAGDALEYRRPDVLQNGEPLVARQGVADSVFEQLRGDCRARETSSVALSAASPMPSRRRSPYGRTGEATRSTGAPAAMSAPAA